ncbi:MAG: hypothetical protein ABIS86_05075 [Streptosporangiaceae bacterium]
MEYPRAEWDQKANAASIRFRKIENGEVAKNRPVENEQGDVVALLRFAASGELLEVELLDAESQLPRGLPVQVISERGE